MSVSGAAPAVVAGTPQELPGVTIADAYLCRFAWGRGGMGTRGPRRTSRPRRRVAAGMAMGGPRSRPSAPPAPTKAANLLGRAGWFPTKHAGCPRGPSAGRAGNKPDIPSLVRTLEVHFVVLVELYGLATINICVQCDTTCGIGYGLVSAPDCVSAG